MSGFDTSQPVTDAAVLKQVDDAVVKKGASTDADDTDPPEELDDATPGPR